MRPARFLAVLSLGALALGGCSSGSTTSTAASPASAGEVGSGAAQDSAAKNADRSARDVAGAPAAGDALGAETVAGQDRLLARSAWMTLVVDDIASGAKAVRTIAGQMGGAVTAENLSSDSAPGRSPDWTGTATGTIPIAVPADRLDAALTALSGVGKVRAQSLSSQDVTTQTVDTQSRLKTMQASVDRVRQLLSKAEKIGDVVAIESELTAREADLEALQAQLAALKDRVALSPVEVTLVTPETAVPDDGTGFLAGLKAGWRAFLASVEAALTAVGVILPFAVIFGIPLFLLVRWLARRAARRPSGPGPMPYAGMPAPMPTPVPSSAAGATATAPREATYHDLQSEPLQHDAEE